MNRQLPQRGMTLMELMIVVAIVGILGAVAYPGYSSYIQRGRITEATSTLSEFRIKLEQYYQDNRHYGSTDAACGVAMPTGPAAQYFAYTCNWSGSGGATGTNQSFRITATGVSGQGMGGFAFSIDQANLKQTTAFPGASGLPKGCWIWKKGDSC